MMKSPKLKAIFLIGSIALLPLISLIYLAADLTTLLLVPADLLKLLGRILPILIAKFAFNTTTSAPWLIGLTATVGGVVLIKRRSIRRSLITGLVIGALMIVFITAICFSGQVAVPQPIIFLLWLLALGLGWRLILEYIWARLRRSRINRANLQNAGSISRRQFLSYLSTAAAMTTVNTLLGRWTDGIKARQSTLAATIAVSLYNPASFPATLKAKIYPSDTNFQFPEQQMARYQPSSHPFGVCFSGGGLRSFAATMGQMRGLWALGLLDEVGAVSAVSGAAWFNTIFSYAPTDIPDRTLLGPIRHPGEITPQNLAELDPHCIAAPLPELTTNNLTMTHTDFLLGAAYTQPRALNRVYARLLNERLLKSFRLDDPQTFFSLDAESVEQIITRNPALKSTDFYTMRPNHPYLIVGSMHINPADGSELIAHLFEYTPLYVGTPQLSHRGSTNQMPFGGGYVESFAFDSLKPSRPDAEGYVAVTTPEPIFLLSDVMASSGAAPGLRMNQLGAPEWFPEYHYWSAAEAGLSSASLDSFVDSAKLENTGIIPLLRRQYPVILAFVNSRQPLGAISSETVNGVDKQISRLFGCNGSGSDHIGNIQIFPSAKFKALTTGLKKAKANGRSPIFVDTYPILQPNPFDLPPYPDQGEVTVMWFYNDLNQNWHRRLSPQVQSLLTSTEPTNYLANFPHFKTLFQNKSRSGVAEVLRYTPQQINLLAHMWAYTVTEDAAETLQVLRTLTT